MARDAARTSVRGAVAGAIAAGVWALQEPADQRVFGVAYSDSALLGKWVTRGPAWRPVGLVMHVANGALFGAAYALVRDRWPSPPALPAAARGPLAGMAEHLGSWPLVGLADRHHPARDEMPRLAGNARAFAQATWRHLLFGFVLGEVERRLNPPEDEEPAGPEFMVSSNGHGNIAHAMTGAA